MASFASGLTVRTLPIVAAKIGRSTKSTVAISIRCLYPIHHFGTKSGAANVAAPLLTNVKHDVKVESHKIQATSCSKTSKIDEGTKEEEEEEEEQVEMFVSPHKCLGHEKIEWNGPTRGGRYAEPTRFGDWEKKGRCSDF